MDDVAEGTETETAEVPAPAPATSEPPADAERLTVEAWATRKKMLPQVFPGGDLALPGSAGPVARVSLARSSELAPRTNPAYVGFAAARAMRQWPEGLVVTEAEFDGAVAEAMGVTLR